MCSSYRRQENEPKFRRGTRQPWTFHYVRVARHVLHFSGVFFFFVVPVTNTRRIMDSRRFITGVRYTTRRRRLRVYRERMF